MKVEKDRGYAWVILAATFCIQFFIDGIITSFGILIEELLDEDEEIGSLPWIGSLSWGVVGLFSPLATIILTRFNFRIVFFIGSILAAFGCFISFFVTRKLFLILSFGLTTGLGCSIMNTGCSLVMYDYFDKRFGLAMGIETSGSGLGELVIIPIVKLLQIHLSWKGSMIILAGFFLQCSILAVLLKPFKSDGEDNSSTRSGTEISHLKHVKNYFRNLKRVLANVEFLIYITAFFLFTMFSASFFFFIGLLGLKLGYTEMETTYLFSICGGLNVIGEIITGWFVELNLMNHYVFIFLMSGLFSLLTVLAPICRNLFGSFSISGIYGFAYSVVDSLIEFISRKIFQDDKSLFEVSIGVVYFLNGLSDVFGAPIIGQIMDHTDIIKGFQISGYLCFCGTFFVLILIIIKYFTKKDSKYFKPLE